MKYLALLFVLFTTLSCADGKAQGWCEDGGYTVSVPGGAAPSINTFQRSFTSCTVTVYLQGTLTLATLYSDDGVTSKSNPFTASKNGQWFFYASDGTYDITFSGGGIPAPFTLGAYPLLDPSRTNGTSIRIVDGIKFKSIEAAYADGPSTGTSIYVTSLYTTLFPNESTQMSFIQGKSADISCESGAVVGWNQSGYLFDVGSTTVVQLVNIHDCTFSIGSTATGWMQVGRISQNSDPTKLIYGWSFTNLLITGPGESIANKIGMSLTAMVGLTISNFTIQFFEQNAIFDRDAVITANHIRFQGYKFGPIITKQAGSGSAASYTCDKCIFTGVEFLGPTIGSNQYFATVDHSGVTFSNAIYESSNSTNMAILHITANGRGFTDIAGFSSTDGSNLNYLYVWDSAFTDLNFIGTKGPHTAICMGVPGVCTDHVDTANGNPAQCISCAGGMQLSFSDLGDGNAVVFTAAPASSSLTDGHTSIGPIKFKFSSTSINTATWQNASGIVPFVISGVSPSLGGSPVLAGACTVTTASIPGATPAMGYSTNSTVYPGDGFIYKIYCITNDFVVIKLCNFTSGTLTPVASTYVIKAIQ